MNHEEVLNKIIISGDTSIEFAINAVIELHKPQEITLPNGEWGTNCIECDGWIYPCPTVQAIERELA
jgi:hypothetical protein